MDDRAKRKLQLELKAVELARMNLEDQILDMHDRIKELEKHVAIQTAKELELKQKLGE